MEIIPAIDLSGGRIVRLAQGDFERSTDYGDDPVAAALAWANAGATRVHVVDLDGARSGSPMQLQVIGSVVAALAAQGANAEVAGGLRDEISVAAALATGAERVVLGTALLLDPSLAAVLSRTHGSQRIVAALDVRDGLAVGDGWRDGAAGRPVLDALDELRRAGATIFAVTAIARDGLLEGPDLGLLATVRAAVQDGVLIASGGVGTLDDLRGLHDLGADAAIVGRALYERRFTLEEAIAAVL